LVYFSIKDEKRFIDEELPTFMYGTRCGGLSEVYVHADRHMHIYGTVPQFCGKTEPKLSKDFLPTAPK
jgi:hypothetical protein